MWTSFSISSSPPSSSQPRPPRRSSRRPRPPPRLSRPPPGPPRPRPPRGPRPCGCCCCCSSACAGAASATAAVSVGWVLASLVWFSSCILELQSAFAGSVGERLHPAMEQEAATIEHDRRDARLLGALGNGLANRRGAVLRGAGLTLEVLVQRRGRSEGLALRVVDDLHVDVPARTVDGKPRLAGGATAKSGAH